MTPQFKEKMYKNIYTPYFLNKIQKGKTLIYIGGRTIQSCWAFVVLVNMQRGLIGISLEAYWYAAIWLCNHNIQSRVCIYQFLHFSLRSMGMPVGIVLTSKMGSFISTRAPFIMRKDSSAQVRDVWYECRVTFFLFKMNLVEEGS